MKVLMIITVISAISGQQFTIIKQVPTMEFCREWKPSGEKVKEVVKIECVRGAIMR